MSNNSGTSQENGERQVPVWDVFVRLFHWGVAGGFAISYLSGDEIEKVHVYMGYIIVLLLLARLVWGFVGPQHARFSDFVYRPRTVRAYLGDLIAFRAKRYIGHSPAGGAMAVALMLSLAATASVGLTLYAVESGKGPLSLVIDAPVKVEAVGGVQTEREEHGERDEDDDDSVLADIHELLANITLTLVFMHLGGVALASFAHRENLVRSMVSGRKRP